MTTCSNVLNAIARLDEAPWVVSHRGDWQTLPENSIEAALRAFDIGADMVEIDAQGIADGTLIVIHDETLDRTTNLTGAVSAVVPEALQDVRLRASDGIRDPSLTNTPLPRLADLLDALRGKGMINIDTKLRGELDAACALVLDMNMQDQVLMKMLVDPRSDGSEFQACAWFGKVPFMPVILDAPKGHLARDVGRIVRTLNASLVEIQFHDLQDLADLAEEMAKTGTHIWTNTLDPVHSLDLSDSNALTSPDHVWGTLLKHGVRAIQTDQSECLRKYLQAAR